jgi:DNA-binding transcriptional MerR regulator
MAIMVWVSIDVNVNVMHSMHCRELRPRGCLLCETDPAARSTTMANTYTISDLAKEFDLTTRAIRFYEDMGLLQPERTGPAGRNRVYSARDRTRLRLTLRAKRLGLSLTEAKEIIDLYDSPRDTGVQLRKFLDVLVVHRKQLEEQMADLQANLEEVQEHENEARALLLKVEKQK